VVEEVKEVTKLERLKQEKRSVKAEIETKAGLRNNTHRELNIPPDCKSYNITLLYP
jgi:hypothetical protein